MSDDAPYDVPAAVRESAKALQEGTKAARDLGSFFVAVSGSLPDNVFGVINDRLMLFRQESWIGYVKRLQDTVKKSGLDPSQIKRASPSIEIPIIEAATLEDRPDLQDMWDRLIAAAVLPTTRNRVRVRHIEILRKLEPLDALLLKRFEQIIINIGNDNELRNFLHEAARLLEVDNDEVHTSVLSLAELRLCTYRPEGYRPYLNVEGRNFLQIVSPESKVSV